VKAAFLEIAMISLQAGCIMRCGDLSFSFFPHGRIRLTNHLESRITCHPGKLWAVLLEALCALYP